MLRAPLQQRQLRTDARAARAAYQHPDLNEMIVNIQEMLIQPSLYQPRPLAAPPLKSNSVLAGMFLIVALATRHRVFLSDFQHMQSSP